MDDIINSAVLHGYLQSKATLVPQLRQNLSDGNTVRLATAGHRLYGSGATYGMRPISAIGANMERAAQKGDIARLAQLITALEQFITNKMNTL